MVTTEAAFTGSKAAILIGGQLLTVLRDDRPDIPGPDMWDLVGGGAEPGEGPWACLCREAMEEVGLDVSTARILWERRYEAVHSEGWVMFYVLEMNGIGESDIRFGDEGQRWALIPPRRFLTMPRTVPSLPPRLAAYFAAIDAKRL